MIPRDEITHYILRVVDSGLCDRKPAPPNPNNPCGHGWRITIDGEPAPDTAYWALTTLWKHELITWVNLPINTSLGLATITAAGLTQLRDWDQQLLNPSSSRPLADMSSTELDREAARLLATLNLDNPKDPK